MKLPERIWESASSHLFQYYSLEAIPILYFQAVGMFAKLCRERVYINDCAKLQTGISKLMVLVYLWFLIDIQEIFVQGASDTFSFWKHYLVL